MMKMKRFIEFLYIYIVIAIVFEVVSTTGLKWVKVNIPQYRVPGEMALLQCEFDLGNDTLYSVKWYKDHEEFYSFVLKSRPQANSYNIDGIKVDKTLSDRKNVVLQDVNFKTSGLFRCEVSAEAPSFASAQAEARMEVVSLPKEDPTITGVEPPYQIGDEINLNCTSGKSHPASQLHWYINDQHVTSPEALILYKNQPFRHSLVSSTLGLRFKLLNSHFLRGSMRVKCVAFVSPVLWRGDSESIVKNSPVRDLREALLLVHGSASKNVISVSLLLPLLLCFIFSST